MSEKVVYYRYPQTQYKRASYGCYEHGNAVRKLDKNPRHLKEPAGLTRAKKEKYKRRSLKRQIEINNAIKKNQAKAATMSRTFVLIVAIASLLSMFICIEYIQLQVQKTNLISEKSVLIEELSEIKEENDAYESNVKSSVSLNDAKRIAIGQLGMTYPTEEQLITYELPHGSYVRQYVDLNDVN